MPIVETILEEKAEVTTLPSLWTWRPEKMESRLHLTQIILQPAHSGPPRAGPLGRPRVVPLGTSGHCHGRNGTSEVGLRCLEY